MSDLIFLSALRKEHSGKVPFWFMRQAGRYLPEYRKVRQNFKNFLEFCYTPDAACEVTLQPITRYGMSAAIIFSDILVIPDALGVKVEFAEGHGPILTPVKSLEGVASSLDTNKLQPVYEAIRRTRAALPTDTALIGFCGLPWTLACYMVEGRSSRDFAPVRATALKDPVFFSGLIERLTDAVITHSLAQIEAGAQTIQLFDSWAGVLSEAEFEAYSIIPTQRIVAAIKAKYPHIPVIGFPRLAGSKVVDFAKRTGVDALSIDGSVSLEFARDTLQPLTVVQGNLDSLLVAEDAKQAVRATRNILQTLGKKPFIFNLAHGILPHTSPDTVRAVCDEIHSFSVPKQS
jgi:uroporphyrinogen decarboxylase